MKMGDTMLNLYVLDAVSSEKVPAEIDPASKEDLAATHDWQTNWESTYARQLPNKVALHRKDNYELLGLMSYELDERGLAVEVLYMESARHSNANLLHATGEAKRYIGIAKAMFAYAVRISKEAGFDGVLIFKAKTSELLEYYMREFGARQVGTYDPFRLVLWEDAAEALISEYRRDEYESIWIAPRGRIRSCQRMGFAAESGGQGVFRLSAQGLQALQYYPV